ncbi:hypothetical protein R2215_003640 [Cronobacter turicensis]|nr:hypothetical protein [Cronobacter turicensis]ELQ6130868.1 hypothetical protein [Cronobacter turicensis]
MKERPIIFNAEMVRAVLNGSKTQTRRIMKVQPESNQFGLLRIADSTKRSDIGKYHWAESNATGTHARSKLFACPHGAVGDRLWVRETWSDVNSEGCPAVAYRADSDTRLLAEIETFRDEDGVLNTADPRLDKYWFAAWSGDLFSGTEGSWRPSIHMPRWASRITLEITGVRVERLQAITLGDICKEFGCGLYDFRPATYGFQAWEELWKSIYGDDSFQANPWVWVIEFKRVEGGEA